MVFITVNKYVYSLRLIASVIQRNVVNNVPFLKEISEILKAARTEQDYPIIAGGDFNVVLDPDLDGRGGNNRKKD